MKILVTLCAGCLLFALLISTVAAQDGAPESAVTDLPWGLVIEFAPETTLQEANLLRIKYDLVPDNLGYLTNDNGNHNYAAPADDDFSSYQRYYYYGTAHGGCVITNSCPPILVSLGYFEPVTNATAIALQNEPIVSGLENQNDVVFFWTAAIQAVIEGLFDLMSSGRIGLAGSS